MSSLARRALRTLLPLANDSERGGVLGPAVDRLKFTDFERGIESPAVHSSFGVPDDFAFSPRRYLLAGGRERRNQCKCFLRSLLNAMAEFERWSIATEVRARRSAAGSVGGNSLLL